MTHSRHKRKKKVEQNGKTRINLRIPTYLDEWVQSYAERTHTNLTAIVVAYLSELKRQVEEGSVEQV